MPKFKVLSCVVESSITEKSTPVKPPVRVPPVVLSEVLISEIAGECDVLKACDELSKSGTFEKKNEDQAAAYVQRKLNALLAKHRIRKAADSVIIIDEDYPLYRPKGSFHEVVGWMMRKNGDRDPLPVKCDLVYGQLRCLLYGCFRIVIERLGNAAKPTRKASKTPARRRSPRKGK